jgi:hypothetical protein
MNRLVHTFGASAQGDVGELDSEERTESCELEWTDVDRDESCVTKFNHGRLERYRSTACSLYLELAQVHVHFGWASTSS